MMMDHGEAWFRYFDQGIENTDVAHVITTAKEVCSNLGFNLDKNCEVYLTELTELPRNTIYLTSLELKNSSDIVQTEELKDHIICAIYYGLNGLKWSDFSDVKSAGYSTKNF